MNAIIRLSNLEANVLYLFARKFGLRVSILQLAKEVKTHYANVYKAVKVLEKRGLIELETVGKASICSLNMKALTLPIYLSFVEELKAQDAILKKFPFFRKIIEEARRIAPLSCIGVFGSYAAGNASAKSDIDVFILTGQNKLRDFRNFIPKYFPELENRVDLNALSFEEFSASLKAKQFTVSQEIAKNKLILFGAETFYQIFQEVHA